MTDLEKFKEILESQAESGVRSGDWPECEYDEREADRHIDVIIESVQVTFRCRTNGRFVGIENWKE